MPTKEEVKRQVCDAIDRRGDQIIKVEKQSATILNWGSRKSRPPVWLNKRSRI